MSVNLITYPDREALMIDLANLLAEELSAALMSKGTASMAVPGGSTPGPVFDALCAADLDWSAVTIMPSDERCVPESHARSNARLLRERLLVNRAAAAQFLSFSIDAETGLEPLRGAVAPHLPLDLLVLGMGADMHTASLFPGAPELNAALAADAPDVVTMTPGDGLEPRVTLSGPVLSAAVSTHILITGAEKRTALEKAAALSDTRLAPIRTVLQQATVHWAE